MRFETDMRVRSMMRPIVEFVSRVLPFLLLFLAWYSLTATGTVPPAWLPRPHTVLKSALALTKNGEIFSHIGASLGRLSLGFAVSAILGIGFGIVVGFYGPLSSFLEPLISFFNAIAGIAWIPLAITWFGLGTLAVTFILWNAIFFLVFFNTLTGVRSVPTVFHEVILTLGGRKIDIVKQVLIPGALPNIVAGMRSGLGFGWRALIAAEMIAATRGLGFMIFDARHYFRSDIMLLGILTIGVIWLLTDRVFLVPLEKWTIERWGSVTRLY